MKTQKIFLVTITEKNGKVRKNPLFPNEFHLAKTMLNDSEVESIKITIETVTGFNQFEIDNKVCLMF